MRLTDFTDYALRVLIYCASTGERLVTIGEMAEVHQVSKNHLMKVVNQLTKLGLLEAVRGRNGGTRLARPPSEIRIGSVVRATEPDFRQVECFGGAAVSSCPLTGRCKVEAALHRALAAYFGVLDDLTLADIADPIVHKEIVIEWRSLARPSAEGASIATANGGGHGVAPETK